MIISGEFPVIVGKVTSQTLVLLHIELMRSMAAIAVARCSPSIGTAMDRLRLLHEADRRSCEKGRSS